MTESQLTFIKYTIFNLTNSSFVHIGTCTGRGRETCILGSSSHTVEATQITRGGEA